jgi:small subunit ribosomal protein S3
MKLTRGGDCVGQKVHPIGFRLGTIKQWNSKWFAEKDYATLLHEDLTIRNYIMNKLSHAAVSAVEIERVANKASKVKVNISTARPGIIIGKKGAEVENLKNELQALTKKEIIINIKEIRKAETEAKLVAENVAFQLQRRVAFRRAMKRSVNSALRLGAQRIKIACSGRLGGHEMARREWYREGRVPLHTIRADIDYGLAEARTTYGIIGIKVWIFNGEVISPREGTAV